MRTNERTVSYPEKVDIVLILVDSKCNFVTCEFVTISTSNNRSRIVILIYNILYIYINYYYLLFVISSSFLIFLPLYRTSLMSQIHMSQSITFSKCTFLIRLIVFSTVRTVRSFVCSLQWATHSILPTPRVQPFVPLSAPHPLRGGVPGKGGGVNKQCSHALQTMALCAINYGSFWWKLWQFLVESASNADSGNVILWQRERQTLVASTAFSVF